MIMKKSLLQHVLLTLTLLLGAMSVASAADRLYIDAVYIEPGETQTIAINLENEVPYYGFQADINLPKGLEFVIENDSPSIFLSARTNSSYSLVTNLVNLGFLRVGAFSSNHTSIAGTSGTLLFVKVSADDEFVGGQLALSNIHFIGENDLDIVFPNFTMDIRNEADNKCYLPNFSIADGQTKTVSLILDNETPFTAFQTDIYLPDGLTIVDDSFKVTNRALNHTISAKSFGDGRMRIICFSPSSSVIASGTGSVVEFDIRSNISTEETYTIELKNQTFSTSTAEEYVLPNSTSNVTIVGTLVSEIILNESRAEMNVGETLILTATINPSHATNKDIEWFSSNPEVATVSSLGIVTAVGEGIAIITVSSTDGSDISATCDITVHKIVTDICLNETDVTLNEGQTLQLEATVSPETANNKVLQWSSSNEGVATVDQSGLVTAISHGSAVITVSSTDGSDISAKCSINVYNAEVSEIIVDGITISTGPFNVNIHGTYEDTIIRLLDIDGRLLYIGNDTHIEVPKAGVYILIVHNKIFKIKL